MKKRLLFLPFLVFSFYIHIANAASFVTVVNASTFGLNVANTDLVNGVAVASMASYANTHPYTKVVVNPGIYKIKRNSNNVILFSAANNVEFDGGGATFIFSETDTKISGSFFLLNNCQNMTIRNLIIDWDWDLAPISAIGKITEVRANGVVYEIMNNVPINGMTVVNGGREWDNVLKCRSSNGFPLGYIGTQQWLDSKHLFVEITNSYRLSSAKVGLCTMLSLDNNFSANAFAVETSNSTLFDNITVYSAPENSFYFTGCKSYTITNCNVIPKPGSDRYRSVLSGGEFHNSEGNIVFENNTTSYTHDDGMHMSDGFIPPYMTNDSTNTKGVVADYLQQFATKYTLTVGDTLEFRNADFSPTGITAVLLSAKWTLNLFPTSTIGNHRCTLVFDRIIPALPVGAYLFNKRFGRATFRIANNTYSNNFCDGIVCCIPNGIIENNCISRTGYSGLRVYLTLRWNKWVMGTGPSNVIIRNNNLYECNNGTIQLLPACFYVGAGIDGNGSYTSSTYRSALTNVTITGNTVFGSDSPGFALTSVTGATVENNTLINVGRAPVDVALKANGNIFVENANNVQLINNKIIQPSGTSRKGLVIATSTTNVTSAGLKQLTQQTVPAALAATSIQANSFVAKWKKVAGATSYLLFVYKKDYNQTTDSLIKQYSVTDSSYVVTNLLPNQKYGYKVSIQPSFCNEEMLTLSNMIYVTTTPDLSTIYPVDSLDISIYPTLCDDELFLNNCDSAKYSVFNILGKIQLNGLITASSITVASLHSGTYFIRIEFKQGSIVRKFVKR